jgi:hypothetical protein
VELWLERRALALKHLESGRRIIERQRQLIARRKAIGANTNESERLLESFEHSQMIFDQDLADPQSQVTGEDVDASRERVLGWQPT